MYFVGIDVGSVAIKIIIMDEQGNITKKYYRRHHGHPIKETLELLRNVKDIVGEYSLSITGNASKPIANCLGVKTINEIVSQSYSIKKLFPWINTIIEMGGEDSKIIILEDGNIKDFSMNSVCAAGTGSFLEQQAERLKLSIEEFSEIALRSKRPSKIAGRCSVFAKSDMIHLQQIATPVEDIIAGLCFAVARNFKGTIAKGRDLRPPVCFQGGVAANKGMIRAFKEVFELDELFIPPDFAFMGAIGAALKDKDEGSINRVDLEKIEGLLLNSKSTEKGHAPLVSIGDDFYERHIKASRQSGIKSQELKDKSKQISNISPIMHDQSRIKAYLGIDIGSISTNLAVIDEEGNLLAKRYLMTAGRPIEAVKQGLDEIYEEIGRKIEVLGVGTTGSGRYMIADYVGADIVKNEITAQATAAMFIDPDVDTIFEIGGQDSKYISIKDGTIVDFEMNKACAAGTGSFLEEQAEKLDIDIKDEFAKRAFSSKSPCRLGERCTVFMENSLMANLQKGKDKDDLLAGLAYSIVQNYINRVVAGKHIGEKIFFQGGVAFNKAVVAAFEKYTEKKIIVPPHHDVTGAIGMALIAKDFMERQKTEGIKTRFKGFELSKKPYEISSFECKSCPNVCEINKVKIKGEEGYLFYGGRCEKYDVRRSQKISVPDLFSFRDELLWKHHERYKEYYAEDNKRKGIKIGIPYIFFFHDFLPYWTTLLWELGFDVVISPKTNKQIINLGVENVLSETCFPVKVAHGHIKWLSDLGLDMLFVPSIINLNQNDIEYKRGVACPYVQTIPYLSKAAMRDINLIRPVIDMSRGKDFLISELEKVFKGYRITKNQIINALNKAELSQREFQEAIKQKGEEILSEINKTKSLSIVIVGRAYNSFDSGINLQIPQKLAQLGVLSIPMDMLPFEKELIYDRWPNMYWRSGQRILRASQIIRDNPNLYAVYIGNFSCGPDSFILKYFAKEMAGKPFLHIEIDEHSADAGVITRCEAFLDSIRSQDLRVKSQDLDYRSKKNLFMRKSIHSSKKPTVYIPNMTDHAYGIAAAFERCGMPAEVLPLSDRQSVDLGKRHLSGKECYPCTVTTGDMLKKIQSPDFVSHKSAFFMPTACGPCRFGQYNVIQRLILDDLGYDDVIILSPEQHSNTFQEIGLEGKDFTKIAWRGIVAFDILYKCLHETRPYEKEKGLSEELYENYKKKIYQSLKGLDGNIDTVMSDMKKDFSSVPKIKDKRPLIGIVGEIFVRTHIFSNENLIRRIEDLGGEVWLAPMGEWIYYVNFLEMRRRLIKKDLSAIIKFLLKKAFQHRVEHHLSEPFKDFLKTVEEPSTKEVLKKASPYVDDSFEGETILSIGKTIDLIERGASGIINTMPFGCMPGTIVTALLRVISRDYNIPCISIPYDGTESSSKELQLEAFMEATKSRR